MIVETGDALPRHAIVFADEETRRRCASPPDPRLTGVTVLQPEGVVHRPGDGRIGRLLESRRSFGLDPACPAVRGSEDRRSQMTGGGRHEHGAAGSAVHHQMADDLAQVNRPFDHPVRATAIAAPDPRPLAGADEKPNAPRHGDLRSFSHPA